MSVPFPTQDSFARPFEPMGQPLIQGGDRREYLPVPSPNPHEHQRPRHHSQNSHNDGHHHSSTSRSRHHSRTESHGHEHHHHHRSHSRDRTHSHGHSHSHSRPRHHSSSGKNQAPVIVVPAPQLTSHYSEPHVQHPQYYAPPMAATNTYGPPVSSPYTASSFAQPLPHGAPVYAGSQVPAYAGSAQHERVPVYAGSSTHGQYGSLGSSYQPPRSMPMAEPSVPRDMHLFRTHRRTYSQPTHQPMQQPVQQRPQQKHNHSFMHPLFKLSRCTGRRKAVCIGVNYTGTAEALEGCVNDAKNMYHFLTERGYPKKDILYLVDTSNDPRSRPTRENMLAAMRWLVKDAQQDDALFFHYSGHGGQVRDRDGDEADGMDEVIFPVDYKTAGIIVDDLLHEILVKPLPPGCRLTALFDSCHSGSILDLPYLYHSNGRQKGSDVTAAFKKQRMTPADVITWSGSADSQTSADTVQNGLAVGAMSHAFVKILKRNPNISYQDMLKGVRDVLKNKYSQKPQLSSSHHINTNSRFII
ncbi:unnamed protein product [Peniophora sp. CBMAI 1063]|nr:unnamed protein product [Peniophora sp. CBMAI 1063]